ncbi:leucine--tRNA ligase [Patescibacteria group bacterium]|nr:leucine--tRNA ligase [Patescibacteria group bacterium]
MKSLGGKLDHQKNDIKWQRYWLKHKLFATRPRKGKKKYILDMFPYPSGDGLHVGHPRGYTASDILAHYYRYKGYNVLHPIGFDAFGLPAENAAIKKGVHPEVNIKKNTKRFMEQLKMLGFSYDWERVINTSEPSYYRWTQWLFLLLYKNGLAYRKESYVNWCPKDKTVLANEQVVHGCCERCGSQVSQEKRRQWFFKITELADQLLSGLDDLDWPNGTKELQRNWIGRSKGADIEFKINNSKLKIKVFTTRPDTLFGATYLVLAPEYKDVLKIVAPECLQKVEDYIKTANKKTELERVANNKDKTGVFSGSYAVNPATNQEIPIWIADYVLGGYGYGAIMAVPAHDERDWDFARKYKLPIVEVIDAQKNSLPFVGDGKLINSGKFSGMVATAGGSAITKLVGGKLTTKYKLRDWLVSRQRYWGAPIPVFYDKDDKIILVDEKDLPLLLPKDVEFNPTGESPLMGSKKFKQIPLKYKKLGAVRREYDTLDTFVCSSWYFMRYVDNENNKSLADLKKLDYWLPVDVYIGGTEFANSHLLFARFITKVLYKLGLINFDEPFKKLQHQGLVLGDGGEKMSKSKGNVVNPDEIVEGYGADALRVYEMFMGPFDQYIPWSMAGVEGAKRFINRLWGLNIVSKALETDRAIHKLISKVTSDIESLHFNTAVSSFMEFVNLATDKGITLKTFKTLAILVSPFAPHLAEEINHKLGSRKSVFVSKWPEFDAKLIEDPVVTIAVQVDGKLRATLDVGRDISENKVKSMALAIESVSKYLINKDNSKYHYVPRKIINFISK